MRIRFIQETVVALANIPDTAWGRLQLRYESVVPVADEATGAFVMPPSPPPSYFFPVGAVVELPNEMAAGYIAADVAETYEGACGPFVPGDRPEVAP